MDIQTLTTMLKTKYPECGLSENEIKGIATSLFATGLVTDENASSVVDAQADAMKGLQGVFDHRFNARKENLTQSLEKSFLEKYKIDENGKQRISEPTPPEDPTAKTIETLKNELASLKDKVAKDEETRAAELRMSQITEAAQRNGIPTDLVKMLNVPQDVTDLDSYMKDASQTFANLGLSKITPPPSGAEPPTDGEAFAAQIKAGGKTEK